MAYVPRDRLPKIEWRPWTFTPFPFAELERQQRLERAALADMMKGRR